MAVNPTNAPDPTYSGDAAKSGTGARQAAGTSAHAPDSTGMTGQYPVGGWGNAIFGGPLPDGTGAPGSAGPHRGGEDPTNEPGQTQDTFTGIPDGQIGGTGATGAPGTGTTPNNASGSGTSITYTEPGAYLSGTYTSETFAQQTSGPQDSTQANDEGYATGGPQLPGLKGNEPTPLSGRYQTGGGHVMRGGRAINP